MKLIDKDALLAEIERLVNNYDKALDYEAALEDVRNFIDTLEVKEVDFDAEWVKYFENIMQEHFDSMNRVGLGELLLFSDGIKQFVENDTRRHRLLRAIVFYCGSFQVSARSFVRLVSYEDFKKHRGISEIAALGLRLYLLYQCGVDWLKPNAKIKAI